MTKQEEILQSHLTDGGFKCPQCGVHTVGWISIENEDAPNELPQIYCHYGCGYMFLETKPSEGVHEDLSTFISTEKNFLGIF